MDGMGEITQGMRTAAKNQPHSWFPVVDPFFDPEGQVPAYGIVGWYWVDAHGQLAGEFNENPRYLPSPLAMNFPEPRNRLEFLLHCAATGYTTAESFANAVANSQVLAHATADRADFSVFEDVPGQPYMVVFTSESKVPEGRAAIPVDGPTLALMSEQVAIRVDPGTPMSVTVPVGKVAAQRGESPMESPSAAKSQRVQGLGRQAPGSGGVDAEFEWPGESSANGGAPARRETPGNSENPAHAGFSAPSGVVAQAEPAARTAGALDGGCSAAPAHAAEAPVGAGSVADSPAPEGNPASGQAPVYANIPGYAESPAYADFPGHAETPAHAPDSGPGPARGHALDSAPAPDPGRSSGPGQADDREPPSAHDRFMASMLAGSLGDALGYAVEFQSVDQIRRIWGESGLTEPVYQNGLAQISDDTQMMLFTLEGLVRAHVARRIEPRDSDPAPEVQHAYQRWLHTQNQPWAEAAGPYARHLPRPDGWLITHGELFASRAPGNTCLAALSEFARTHNQATFSRKVNNSKGCGGVMRAAPVAVWSNDPAEVFYASAAIGALTHSHPSGYLSAGVLATIVHQLIRDVPIDESVRLACELLRRWSGYEEQLRALEAAQALARRGRVSPEELTRELGEGWVGEQALAVGLYAVLTTATFADAVLLSVNHSGDSDSTGIVCGNIAGALYGTRSIPPDWLGGLELREITRGLVRDALAEFSPGPPNGAAWTQRYPAW